MEGWKTLDAFHRSCLLGSEQWTGVGITVGEGVGQGRLEPEALKDRLSIEDNVLLAKPAQHCTGGGVYTADRPEVRTQRKDPGTQHALTGSGSGSGSSWGSWPGLDFFGLEGPAGLEKDFGNLAEDDVRGLADPEGPPSRCPPPEKGTKGAGEGSFRICSV
ncbi:hypothetical protein CB1_000058009 [Camelus ferus]|nr:hypothetical protein CB1_000058009 [Camelus ferus]